MPGRASIFALLLFAASASADDAEFFEKKIRPLLAEHCYSCHSENAKKLKGGLRVDGRSHLLRGGESGPALVPNEPGKSKLIEAIRYTNADLQMPPKGKLPAAAIADLETWVKSGAVWPGDDGKAVVKAAFDLAKRKAEHWSWQPVKQYPPPPVKNEAWIRDPLDRFILAKLEAQNLKPATAATKSVWLRRVTFALTGLPPTPEEIAAFEADHSENAFEKVADRLLASPAYGERWARHWLDLVRYAESRGHEFDHDIPNAWQYRDYLIRAFNADVPYDKLVLEHLAGDVLGARQRVVNGADESVIGTAFWRLGEEVHSPVDIRQDQADRYDNRIDVFGKAFLGLTVACARCHDHKFDAISTKDYYALFGLLEGSSDRMARMEGGAWNERIAEQRDMIFTKATEQYETPDQNKLELKKWFKRVNVVNMLTSYEAELAFNDSPIGHSHTPAFGIYRSGRFSIHAVNGVATLHQEERGAFVYDRFWEKLATAKGTGKEIGKLGTMPRAGFTIRTPSFTLEKDNLYYLVRGGGMAYAAVGDHTLIEGPLHGGLVEVFKNKDEYRWVKHSLKDYKGQRLHVELTANAKTEFAVSLIVQADEEPTMPPAPVVPVIPEEKKAEILKKLQAELAKIEEPVWESRLVPAIQDGSPVDEAVFIRGNPRMPGEIVPHRGLEALDGPNQIKHERGSGRLEFAERITDPKANPYLARVAVNRFWHHLFGRGIVASTDNFGVLGERPTHPELLDYLASEFTQSGFKIKPYLKRLVLSQTYRMSSSAANDPLDPSNNLLHHFRLMRLEGEAIRDSMLAVSGRLDVTLGGPPVPVHLTPFMEGRGRPGESGPLDGRGRRSIYLSVRRNFLSPFLLAFDMPIPFSTVGTRTVSNVPAQALILLNDPFVHEMAHAWGKAIAAKLGTIEEKIATMYFQAFARMPSDEELKACRAFLPAEPNAAAWGEFAHSLFNVKEFRFIP